MRPVASMSLQTPPSAPPSAPHRWLPWAALAVVLALYAWQQLVPSLGPAAHMNDFKHLWAGAQMLAAGIDPYDRTTMVEFANAMRAQDARFASILPYVYLPFAGVVVWPLSQLPFGAAALVWTLINHALILAGVAMAARAGGWRWTWPSVLLIGAGVAFNFAIWRQNSAGQMNAVLLAGWAAVALGLRERWPAWSLGVIAAFLALFKVTPGILLVYFLLTRRWREAAWMAGAGAAMLLLTIGLVGIEPHLAFLRMLPDMGYGRSTWPEEHTFWRDSTNQSINAFAHRTLVAWPGFTPWADLGPAWANRLTMAATAVVLGVWVWGTLRTVGTLRTKVEREEDTASISIGFSLTVLASLLVPSICWDHYGVQALVPALLLWNVCACRSRHPVRAIIAACVVVLAWPIAFHAGAAWGIAEVLGTIDARRGAGLLFHSAKLWPLLVLFSLGAWMAWRRGGTIARNDGPETRSIQGNS